MAVFKYYFVLYFLVVNYQSYDLVARLVDQIMVSEARSHYYLVIVNNFPPETSVLQQLTRDNIQIIEAGENLGFGKGCNLGLNWIYQQNSQGLVWLLNPDTFIDPKMIPKTLSFLDHHPELSILGTVIYSTDKTIWFGGGRFDPFQGKIIAKNLFTSSSQTSYLLCDWVSGCSMIINLSHFSSCPQFDPNYFLYYEDFDFCQRYKKQGHLVAVIQEISIIHQVSTITNRNFQSKFYHSTYSYLLTLERYTSKIVFFLRLLRLLTYASLLLLIKPAIAFGKITGTWYYFKQKFS